ncbi:hypothetical protein REPUB_Repub01dG0032400 [Reevesia pubescens]
MAAERVTLITCILILLLFATWISFAQARQAGRGIPADSNHKTVSTGKGLLAGERVGTAATNKINSLGGRKMVDRQMKEQKDVKMIGGVGGRSSSKFSSTNSKCGNNLGCHDQQIVNHFSDEVDDHNQSGFVAFNADYHAPRHHPPKNN